MAKATKTTRNRPTPGKHSTTAAGAPQGRRPQAPADARHRMIAEAAYFRSLGEGQHHDALGNWLAAEQEIDHAITTRSVGKSA